MKLKGKDIIKALKDEGENRAFVLEMRTKEKALVGGVCGVEISAPEQVSLRLLGGGELVFAGKGLCCTSFGNRAVEIEGIIDSVNFGALI